jgi:hypothetical protein
MRISIQDASFTIWLSASDTWTWANGYPSWPCSTLEDKRICASFDDNGIVDLTVNGRDDDDDDIDGSELSSCVADHAASKLSSDHPAYDVAVGQFIDER